MTVKNPRVAIGVTALAGLTALGGVGAIMNSNTATVNGAGPAHYNVTEVATTSSKSSTSSSSSSSQSNGNASAKLMGMLPAGFNSSNCQAVQAGIPDSVATVDCAQNSSPNGPTAARFAIFSNQQTLDRKFGDFIGEDQLANCPGGGQSPGTWSYNSNSDAVAGQIACGTFEGTPELIWTQNVDLLLGSVQGSDAQSLYNYWSNPSGSAQLAPNTRGG